MTLVLGGPEYLPGAMTVLQFMAWSMPIGWMNSLTQYVLIALDQQRYLTRAYLIGFGFSLISNLLLMPRFGYRASAILHIFAELALLIPFVIGLRKYLGKINWKSILGKPLLSAGIASLVAVLLLPINRWLALIGASLTYPLAVWKLNVLSPEERTMLAPLLKRRN
jgi:O-antigen/teichoic acid export membrane protein